MRSVAAQKTLYVCSSCGSSTQSFARACPSCGEIGTLESREVAAESGQRAVHSAGAVPAAEFTSLDQLEESVEGPRMSTGIPELDRVLGGGMVEASYIVLSGEPGAGKTTMASEISLALAAEGKKVAYVSGEESLQQAQMRFNRLKKTERLPEMMISTERSVERICEAIASVGFDLLVVDSIQTAYSEEGSGDPGSTSQVKLCGHKLMSAAKTYGCSILIIGQVIKDGTIAGPRQLEHLVDAVLSFEGDRREQYRLLRAVKNRFGTTDEIGVFEMTSTGLVGVEDPSQLFIGEESEKESGSVLTAVIEGTRPVVCEVQALVVPSNIPQPQRAVRGFDPKKITLLLAVLQSRMGLPTGSLDVFINVSGGLKIDDPGADLAVCLAILASHGDALLKDRYCVFGEVSLLGQLRKPSQQNRRSKEAERLGLKPISPDQLDNLSDLERLIKPPG